MGTHTSYFMLISVILFLAQIVWYFSSEYRLKGSIWSLKKLLVISSITDLLNSWCYMAVSKRSVTVDLIET
jgi:uncharacterized membrane protein YqjE